MTVLDKHEIILSVLTDEYKTTKEIEKTAREVHSVEIRYNDIFGLYMAGKCSRGTVFKDNRELWAFKK